MADLSNFDPNSAGNPNNNIFGLPFTEEEARLIVLPIPWEVTVSYNAGTARSAEHIFKASLQVDLMEPEWKDGWKRGIYMRSPDKRVLLKSDYLRKEAELLIAYITKGEEISKNNFMCKSLKDINEGSLYLNNWVYQQTAEILKQGKLVALLGGDHSTPLGYLKALAEQYPEFGILQIDAHFDLRKGYEGFKYSHASIMYNALNEIPAIKKLVPVGIRDYCQEEFDFLNANSKRIQPFLWSDLKVRQFEGACWKDLVDDIVDKLPQYVYLSFDIDGLDPKLCPNTGTPVHGGLEVEQVFYLLKRMLATGRKLIGFDISEVGVGETDWDANVGARILWKLCNMLITSNG
jgi:agmatinase